MKPRTGTSPAASILDAAARNALAAPLKLAGVPPVASAGPCSKTLESENKRLRAALALIGEPMRPNGTYALDRTQCGGVARAALKGGA